MPRLLGLLLLSTSFLFSLSPHAAQAQAEGTGVGVSLGTSNSSAPVTQHPVGFAAKTWLSDTQALAGMTSFYIGGTQSQGNQQPPADPSYWLLQADYLFHNFNELQVDEGYLALYVGAGAQVTILEDTDNQVALRVPIGADYMLGSAPVDIFVEVAPSLNVTDPAGFRFDGAIGFRYFFSSGGEAE
jgi:hypothetical protein